MKLGNDISLNTIPPCNNKCQLHTLGHLFIGDTLSETSAEILNTIHQAYSLGEVPNWLLPIDQVADYIDMLSGSALQTNDEHIKDTT